VIGRKQRSRHEDWLESRAWFYGNPDTLTARGLVAKAAHRLQKQLGDLNVTRPVYGWSGGKDSQALRIVAEAAGVTDCVLVLSELEYPAFLAWATDHMPWGLHVETRPLDMAWLRDHQDMLFPPDSRTAAKWFRQVQHDGQRHFCAQHNVDGLVLGRRLIDGNQCGADGVYLDRDRFWRISPLYDWTHEDLLCVLGANQAPLPPCYDWPRGWQVGTGPWPARQWTTSLAHGWAEVLTIDPDIVEHAADMDLVGARDILARVTELEGP